MKKFLVTLGFLFLVHAPTSGAKSLLSQVPDWGCYPVGKGSWQMYFEITDEVGPDGQNMYWVTSADSGGYYDGRCAPSKSGRASLKSKLEILQALLESGLIQ